MFEIIILTFSVLINLFLAYAVLISDSASKSNRAFALFTVSLSLWSIATYWSLHPFLLPQVAIVRIILLLAVVQVSSIYISVSSFPDKNNLNRSQIGIILAGLLIGALTQTELVFSEAMLDGEKVMTSTGSGIYLFAGFALLCLMLTAKQIINRSMNGNIQVKLQMRTIGFGLFASFSLIVLSNFIFVALLDNSSFIKMGPLFTLFAVGGYTYSILRHRLYDVPLVFFRATMYFATLFIVLVVPIIIFAGLLGQSIVNLGTSERIIFLSFILILAASSFKTIQSGFDRVTNSLFQRITQKRNEEVNRLQTRIEQETINIRNFNRKLIKSSKVKNDYINFASHQLRTPINAAYLSNKMMIDGYFGRISKQQRAAILDSQKSLDRMNSMIDQLLEATVIENGEMRLVVQEVAIKEIIDGAIALQSNTAKHRRIDISVEGVGLDRIILVDITKTTEVVSNLLNNAIKYSYPESQIVVRVIVSNKHAQIIVEDKGIGVSLADQKKLFDKHFRSADAKKIDPAGIGLGLYLSKTIILAQKGNMKVKSAIGEGSKIGFILPVKN
jgi:signal transduction histidine kinase